MLQETDALASCRVLLVEDKLDGRATLRNLLELWGHTVETAADGRQAVEKGLAWRPEVAGVDIGLPLLDGYAVARQLRSALGGGRARLIALTAYGSPEDRQRAFDAGSAHHLTKPADPAELRWLLRPA
jgi:CheY-like chemotaxis protein